MFCSQVLHTVHEVMQRGHMPSPDYSEHHPGENSLSDPGLRVSPWNILGGYGPNGTNKYMSIIAYIVDSEIGKEH